MRRALVLLPFLVAACADDGPDPALARLRSELEEVKRDFADFRIEKEREIQKLKTDLAAKAQAESSLGAQAETLQRKLDELGAKAKADVEALEQMASTKAKEAADALARLADTEKLRESLAKQLADTKGLLDTRSAEADAVKAELAKLKKLLGR